MAIGGVGGGCDSDEKNIPTVFTHKVSAVNYANSLEDNTLAKFIN